MSSEERIQQVRPAAVACLGDSASLTTALPGMLEVRLLWAMPRSGANGSFLQEAMSPRCCTLALR